jgi:transposase
MAPGPQRLRKPTHDLRALMNAILYVDRTGIPWRYLPHDYPPHQTVYGYFAHWEADGIFDQLTGLLRGKVRQAEGRTSEPSACLIDSQSIKTSATVHLTSQGIDPAKKIIGRKRHIVTDTLGLLLATAGAQLLMPATTLRAWPICRKGCRWRSSGGCAWTG